jgi:hypothetical protein
MDPRIAPLLGDLLTACQKPSFRPADWEKVSLLAVLLHMSPYQPEMFMVRQYLIKGGCSERRANLMCRQIENSWAALRLYDEERSKGVRSERS